MTSNTKRVITEHGSRCVVVGEYLDYYMLVMIGFGEYRPFVFRKDCCTPDPPPFKSIVKEVRFTEKQVIIHTLEGDITGPRTLDDHRLARLVGTPIVGTHSHWMIGGGPFPLTIERNGVYTSGAYQHPKETKTT